MTLSVQWVACKLALLYILRNKQEQVQEIKTVIVKILNTDCRTAQTQDEY